MNFEGQIKELGEVDVTELREKTMLISPKVWEMYPLRQKRFKQHSETKSLIFQFIKKGNYQDSFYTSPWKAWQSLIQPLIDSSVRGYGYKNGKTCRIMMVNLPAGARVKRHWDSGSSFDIPHRIHIPLQTSPEVEFFVDEQLFSLEVGHAYEINNKLYHEVKNKGKTDRIHLIFDYYDEGDGKKKQKEK